VVAIRALKAFPLALNVSVEERRVLAAWRRYPAGLVGGAELQLQVRKPFRPAELRDRIEAALSRSRASSA
jgi:hypothetical protein